MVTGSQLLFGFGQVKRSSVGFGITGDQVDDESCKGRNMSFENVPSVGLSADDLLDIHGSAEHNHCQDGQSD